MQHKIHETILIVKLINRGKYYYFTSQSQSSLESSISTLAEIITQEMEEYKDKILQTIMRWYVIVNCQVLDIYNNPYFPIIFIVSFWSVSSLVYD